MNDLDLLKRDRNATRDLRDSLGLCDPGTRRALYRLFSAADVDVPAAPEN